MSYWTHITGTIAVEPFGRTQAEKRYILDTVLEHLPLVTGSERNMEVYVVQPNGTTSSSSCDEFGERTNNLVDTYGDKSRRYGWLRTQRGYLLTISSNFRDRTFDETHREFVKWLTRLAKRVNVVDICVKLSDENRQKIFSNANPFDEMYEWPSWVNKNGEPAWWEYLAWEPAKGIMYPMKLMYKYYNDAENDAEMARRIAYRGE